ncbi:hypothetical protein DDP54_01560 [Cellulomonas sp. WB94]|nr:hypothetical protein DDP54_01560 [Cellulomonas sp. WB94]
MVCTSVAVTVGAGGLVALIAVFSAATSGNGPVSDADRVVAVAAVEAVGGCAVEVQSKAMTSPG